MQLILSIILAIFIMISFIYQGNQSVNSIKEGSQAWEHSIVLDTRNSAERKLVKSLSLSNYHCSNINIDHHVECSIKNLHRQSLPKPKISNSRPLMLSSSAYGDTLKVYKNKDGSTHMEIFDNSNQTHRYYSFASTKSLIIYSKVYHNEIFPENLNETPISLY